MLRVSSALPRPPQRIPLDEEERTWSRPKPRTFGTARIVLIPEDARALARTEAFD